MRFLSCPVKKRLPPQKERMAQRDCHVAALLAMTEQEEFQILLTPFTKGGTIPESVFSSSTGATKVA